MANIKRYDAPSFDVALEEAAHGEWVRWGAVTSPAGLHELLDLHVAQFIAAHPSGKGMPSQTTLLAFMQWSNRRRLGEVAHAAG